MSYASEWCSTSYPISSNIQHDVLYILVNNFPLTYPCTTTNLTKPYPYKYHPITKHLIAHADTARCLLQISLGPDLAWINNEDRWPLATGHELAISVQITNDMEVQIAGFWMRSFRCVVQVGVCGETEVYLNTLYFTFKNRLFWCIYLECTIDYPPYLKFHQR